MRVDLDAMWCVAPLQGPWMRQNHGKVMPVIVHIIYWC